MQIEQEENLIKYRDGTAGFTIEDFLRLDKTICMRISVDEYNDAEIWLDPLTVRVMIEQLQKIQKLQEEV